MSSLVVVFSSVQAEQKYGFNMRTSLGRRDKNGLLAGISVFVDPAVVSPIHLICFSNLIYMHDSISTKIVPPLPSPEIQDPAFLPILLCVPLFVTI